MKFQRKNMAKLKLYNIPLGGIQLDADSKEIESGAVPGLFILSSFAITIPCFYLCYKKLYKLYIEGKTPTCDNLGNNIFDNQGNQALEQKQFSDYPVLKGNIDDYQLAGKLLYRDDICLWYGESSSTKTAFTLNIMMDVVLGKKSSLVSNDSGIHMPCHGIFYNGEMDAVKFQKFFGNYNRENLCGKIDVISNFLDFGINDWCADIQKRLTNITTDALVVLDNISCITSSMNGEAFRQLIAKIRFIQQTQNARGLYVAFILISHTNKEKEAIGSMQQTNLVDNKLKFEKNGSSHTRITMEKNRIYNELCDKSFDYEWIISPEGYQSFKYIGEVKTPKPTNTLSESKQPRRESGRYSKTTDEEREEIIRLKFEEGIPPKEIAKIVKKSSGHIYEIIREWNNKKNPPSDGEVSMQDTDSS